MRLSKFTALALLAVVSFAPVRAIAAPAYACQLAEVYECTATAGCQKATGHNLPPAVTLNVKEKNLFYGLFNVKGCFRTATFTRTRRCSSCMAGGTFRLGPPS